MERAIRAHEGAGQVLCDENGFGLGSVRLVVVEEQRAVEPLRASERVHIGSPLRKPVHQRGEPSAQLSE